VQVIPKLYFASKENDKYGAFPTNFSDQSVGKTVNNLHTTFVPFVLLFYLIFVDFEKAAQSRRE